MRNEPPESGLAVSSTVVVDDERAAPETGLPVDVDDCRALVADVLDHEGLVERDLEVHVHLVDEEPMAALNAEYMGGEGSTDVLSFPLEDPADLDPAQVKVDPSGAPLLLGDIVLCPVVAERQAAEHTGDHDTEIALLLVHGVLHLLGHDHAEPTEEAVMQERERVPLARHGKVARREERS